MMSKKHYHYGISNLNGITMDGAVVIQYSSDENSNEQIIQCNIMSKKMKVVKNDSIHSCSIESNDKSIVTGATTDLSNRGDRWEGDLLNGVPFGFGLYYNENNGLIYKGFLYNGKKVCYGIDYYADISVIEYEGGYFNGLRCGFGELHNRRNVLLYSGDWLFGNCYNECSMQIMSSTVNDSVIHNFINDLIIGENCLLSCLRFFMSDFVNLKSLVIGNHSCVQVERVMISNCPELTSIDIGENCFNNYPEWLNYYREEDFLKCNNSEHTVRIHDCDKLESITIGSGSFIDYSGCFELQSSLPIILSYRPSSLTKLGFRIIGMVMLFCMVTLFASGE